MPELNIVDQVILDISSNNFFIFLVRIRKSTKINSLKVYRVFNLSISLMMLIAPMFLSFSVYYLKGTNCLDRNFSLNLFSKKYLIAILPMEIFRF